jgi:hypothetical protein
MKTLLFVGIMLMPCVVLAATDCSVIEYPDHFEAVCIDDALQITELLQIPVPAFVPMEARTRVRPPAAPVQEQTPAQVQAVTSEQILAYVQTVMPGQAVVQPETRGSVLTEVQVETPVPGQPQASAQTSLQERADAAPSSAVLYTRRGMFRVNRTGSGDYTATPTYMPQG